MAEQEIIDYWIRSSDENFQTMQNLFKSGDYSWALFMGHLVIEKLLKAHYVKNTKKDPPLIHDLLRISQKAGIDPEERMMDLLDEITTFNIKGRYDDYKESFKKICTESFTSDKINNIIEVRKWLKKRL